MELTQTTVRVEGNDEDIIFSGLSINQMLADVNSFHFTWRQPEGDASVSAQVSFYNDNLSKEVTIAIGDDFTFKGIIYAISCNNQDSLGVNYEISGKGLFERLNQVPECRSFYHKNITDIFNGVNTASGTTLDLSPSNNSELFYIVQYNQPAFSFYKMMAARYGEWFYYNGTEMVLAAPSGDPVELNIGLDVNNIDISAKMVRAPVNSAAFNRHSGDTLTNEAQSSSGDGFIGASQQAGETAYGSSQAVANITAAATQELLTNMSTLSQQSAAANAVVLRASSNNCNIKLAGKIKLLDGEGNSAGEYIITELHHSVITNENYQNQFVAVPAEVEVPPYTNPFAFPVCRSQPARVVENEDADGLDRVKVHFPWQESSENSPWLNVISPHAGTNKGMRYLPEIDEEVLVDFLDNNAERPYVIGMFHTEQNKSGEEHEGNYVKVIGTKTGRRLYINEKDDMGLFYMMDNMPDDYPRNVIGMTRRSNRTRMTVESVTDEDNLSVIIFDNSSSLKIGLKENGTLIGEILLENSGPKITIRTPGDIEIAAGGELILTGSKVTVDSTGDIKMTASGDAELHGANVIVDADANLDATAGAVAKVEGSGQAELKGGAMTTVSGGIVKIN